MESSSYSENDYPEKFLKGVSVFPEDRRIYHRTDCSYDYILRIEGASANDRGAKVEFSFVSGEKGFLFIEPIANGVIRLKMGQEGTQFFETSPMLMPMPKEGPLMAFQDEGSVYACRLDGYLLRLDKYPFCMKITSSQGELIFELEMENIVGMLTTPPMGFRRKEAKENLSVQEDKWAFLSWHSPNSDRYFGLGEKFTRFEKTSTRATIWEADTCGSNTTDMSYKAVPVLFSTAGWAMMLHSSYRSYWEIGSFSYATASLLVEEPKLDLFLILRPSLKELVQAYTALTGRPTIPPKWALGMWMSRAAYRNRVEMLEVADRLRKEGIPCDVLHIDPSWLVHGHYNEIGVEVCNFEWNYADWGEPEDLFATFAEKGFGICLWSNPYLSEDTSIYAEAKEKGYLVRTVEGGVARLEFGLAAGIVDFTHPEAKQWWQSKLIDLMRKGAAVFKVDFGDRVPENASFYDGRTGKEMHNLYVHLYAEAQFKASEQEFGKGFTWRRPGYIGSQRFIGSWAGDTQVSWEGMRGALRGGLSAAFTGEALWGHDIGGFVGPKPSEELYIRWTQFGMLSPLARFHGTTPREPWHYGATALAVTRGYTRLRYTLIPYMLALCQESTQTGMPLLRPMVMEFQNEPLIDQVDDQYLLGGDLLVAPVFKEGARERWVYFPSGDWYDLDQPGQVKNGPGYKLVLAPLERLPLYVRSGAVLPRYAEAPQHLKEMTPKEWTIDIYPGQGIRRLVIPEDNFVVVIDHEADADKGTLTISPAPLSLTIRLVNCVPREVWGQPEKMKWEKDENDTIIQVDAGDGITVEYRK